MGKLVLRADARGRSRFFVDDGGAAIVPITFRGSVHGEGTTTTVTIDYSSIGHTVGDVAVLIVSQTGGIGDPCALNLTPGWTQFTSNSDGRIAHGILGAGTTLDLVNMSADFHYSFLVFAGDECYVDTIDYDTIAGLGLSGGSDTANVVTLGEIANDPGDTIVAAAMGKSGTAEYDGSGTWSPTPDSDLYDDGREVTFGHSMATGLWEGAGLSINPAHDHTSQAANWSSGAGNSRGAYALLKPGSTTVDAVRVASTSDLLFGTAATFAQNVPSDCIADDLVLAVLFHRGGAALSATPSGFTLLAQQQGNGVSGVNTWAEVWAKEDTDGTMGGTSLSFTQDASNRYGLQVVVLRCSAVGTASIAASAGASGTAGPHAFPSVATGGDNRLWLGVDACAYAAAFAHSAGESLPINVTAADQRFDVVWKFEPTSTTVTGITNTHATSHDTATMSLVFQGP